MNMIRDDRFDDMRSTQESYLGVLWKKTWGLFRRHLALIVSTICIISIPGIILVYMLPSQYTAEALVVIEARQRNVANIKDVLETKPFTPEALNTQIEIIQSREVAQHVVEMYNLWNDPEFNALLAEQRASTSEGDDGETMWEKGRRVLRDLCRPLFTPNYAELRDAIAKATALDRQLRGGQPQDEALNDRFQDDLVNTILLSKLRVSPIKGSHAVVVSFTSQNRDKAARLTNAIVDTYVGLQVSDKLEAAEGATRWLKDEIASLQQKVEKTENAVEAYKRESGLFGLNEQVNSLATRLVSATAERTQAESRLKQIEQILNSGDIESAVDLVDSPLLQALRTRRQVLMSQAAELSSQLGERHPKMLDLRTGLDDIKDKMVKELKNAGERYRNEAKAARANEVGLQSKMNELEQRSSNAQVRLHQLERVADANRQVLERFLVRSQETSAQTDAGLHNSESDIASKASIPLFPSWPPRALLIAGFLVASTMIGAGLASGIELLTPGFRSSMELESATGKQVLAWVPSLPRRSLKGTRATSYVLNNQNSMFAAAIRSLVARSTLNALSAKPKSMLFTSISTAEGKSTIAISLARIEALSGKKVVILEADLRKPVFHRLLDIPPSPGLSDYVLGDSSLLNVLYRDRPSGAYVIPAGRSLGDPLDVFSSQKMSSLLQVLSKQHDLVIIDAPPITVASDAQILAAKSDTTIFVVRWGKTDREIVTYGLNRLLAGGARVGGLVLSLVNSGEHKTYGYVDSAYFSAATKKYFAEA
jgi:capsular exopolysaccharide synthesis family protein